MLNSSAVALETVATDTQPGRFVGHGKTAYFP